MILRRVGRHVPVVLREAELPVPWCGGPRRMHEKSGGRGAYNSVAYPAACPGMACAAALTVRAERAVQPAAQPCRKDGAWRPRQVRNSEECHGDGHRSWIASSRSQRMTSLHGAHLQHFTGPQVMSTPLWHMTVPVRVHSLYCFAGTAHTVALRYRSAMPMYSPVFGSLIAPLSGSTIPPVFGSISVPSA